MIKLLIKSFIPYSEHTDDPVVRKKYGVLGGVCGIVCNGILFIIKLVIGIMVKSIAIISDAFNNLSDMGSSVVSIVGARISARKPDSDHPYGHGRAEYISSLIISILIILVGYELFRSSVKGLFNPKQIIIGPVALIFLILSVLLKLWMWSANRYMGRKINSGLLMATAKDSLNDALATGVVIISALVSPYTSIPLDSIVGIIVSGFIFYAGYNIARETTDKLLGQSVEEKLSCEIKELLMSDNNILGMHGLMVHDYGEGRKIASVHAEVPEDMSLIDAHNIIDETEKKILNELNVDIVIHIDPVKQA